MQIKLRLLHSSGTVPSFLPDQGNCHLLQFLLPLHPKKESVHVMSKQSINPGFFLRGSASLRDGVTDW